MLLRYKEYKETGFLMEFKTPAHITTNVLIDNDTRL